MELNCNYIELDCKMYYFINNSKELLFSWIINYFIKLIIFYIGNNSSGFISSSESSDVVFFIPVRGLKFEGGGPNGSVYATVNPSDS